MKKSWKKTTEGIYHFYEEDTLKGSLRLQLNSATGKATALIGDEVYEIARKGFWKTQIVISDFDGTELLNIKPAKWYGATYDVLHRSKSLRLEIRNNPLAEWALIDGEEVICFYGLDPTEEATALKIGGTGHSDLLYDFLLWYLFLPIATEQTGDAFVFNILLSAQ